MKKVLAFVLSVAMLCSVTACSSKGNSGNGDKTAMTAGTYTGTAKGMNDDVTVEVIKLLASFNEKVQEAADKYEPSVVSRYLVDLAQAFNKFYHDNPILSADEETRKARLTIVKAVSRVLTSGLALLGVQAPEQM